LRSWSLATLTLVVLAAVLFLGRRATIRAFFPDGTPGAPPVLTQPEVAEPGLAPVDRVRVVLLDGLSRKAALELPELSSLCTGGLDLALDVGFPTVSLPIQHVLWTGRTQPQSGVMYRIGQLTTPPADALPVRVPGSIAVGESHPGIVHSFGFTEVAPAMDWVDDAAWRDAGFLAAARSAVASPARLAFVHVLRIDEEGHAHGGASAEYAEAVRTADAWLGELVRADPDPATSRWFVLADHGHRPAGGHGDAEPDIRIVRACIVGGVEPGSTGALHLVDLHRALLDSLGLEPSPETRGRPLAFALAHPEPGATLPRPSRPRWIAAVLVVLAGVLVSIRAAGRRWWAWPWWWPLSYGSVVALYGAITLSNPVVYPPLARDVLVASIPGLLVLAVVLARMPTRATAIAQLALPLALVLAPAVLCGAIDLLVGGGVPPLVPTWTAHASVDATIAVAGCATAATTLMVAGAFRRRAARSAASADRPA